LWLFEKDEKPFVCEIVLACVFGLSKKFKKTHEKGVFFASPNGQKLAKQSARKCEATRTQKRSNPHKILI